MQLSNHDVLVTVLYDVKKIGDVINCDFRIRKQMGEAEGNLARINREAAAFRFFLRHCWEVLGRNYHQRFSF